MANLDSEARKFYQQALYEARQAGPQSGGDEHDGKGAGGPRERSLYDPREYKIADFHTEPSLAAFKKWRHDLEIFLEIFLETKDFPDLHQGLHERDLSGGGGPQEEDRAFGTGS